MDKLRFLALQQLKKYLWATILSIVALHLKKLVGVKVYKKIIKRDMYNITNRIKHIDKNYFIIFNYHNNKFEVHNSNQIGGSYCLTSPYEKLDSRLLDYVYLTSTNNSHNVIDMVEKNNKEIEKNIENRRKDYIDTNLKDIYQLYSCSTKDYDLKNSMKTKWI